MPLLQNIRNYSSVGLRAVTALPGLVWDSMQHYSPRHIEHRWISWTLKPEWQHHLQGRLNHLVSLLLLWAHSAGSLLDYKIEKQKDWSSTSKCVKSLSKSQRSIKWLVVSGSWGKIRKHWLSPQRVYIPQQIPDHGTLRNFTELAGSGTFFRLFSHSLTNNVRKFRHFNLQFDFEFQYKY